ncbi:alpha/beta hydrolase-fold protein [Gemmatimonas sp.]|uniref:alpha/beta hydrolase-fold protein n=1 Tax=Gemmatimonas sp. TaxID=1962908 RepID=UPI0025C639DC|nr:alpha/beta hydrolase-fold protein [Gemmatimonas sp.]
MAASGSCAHARLPACLLFSFASLARREPLGAGGHHAHDRTAGRVAETIDRLDRMNAVKEIIVVGIVPADRMRDYSHPGYEAYGRGIVQQLKPRIDTRVRRCTGPRHTAVMGSSLGGVAALYLAWQYPELFGMAGCLWSTLGVMDDLFARIAVEPRRDITVYLDSGWPRDNFDTTHAMRDLLIARGSYAES